MAHPINKSMALLSFTQGLVDKLNKVPDAVDTPGQPIPPETSI